MIPTLSRRALLAASLLPPAGFVRVSRSDPRCFELSTGEPFIPIGPNICWERFAASESEVFARTERRFRLLAAARGNFTRIWLSHPFYDIGLDGSGLGDPIKVRRVDSLLALARRYGIRLKLCLEHFRTFEDSPPRFPGSVSMGRPEYRNKPFHDVTEFFTGRHGRAMFIQKLDALAARYAGEPCIFGWELWNEINAVKGEGWEQWTLDMLPRLKERFPNHLAMQSLGSFDNDSVRDTYRRFALMPGNEVAQVHRYLDPGAPLDICRGPMDILASEAVFELRAAAVDKPVVLSEVGAVESRHAGPSRLYKSDRLGLLLHDGVFAPFFAGASAPGQFWHWQDYIEPLGLWRHYARFAAAVGNIDPRLENFKSSLLTLPGLRIYFLKGNRTSIAWCRNASSGPVSPSLPMPRNGVGRVRLYDPWGDRWQDLQPAPSIRLPGFLHSAVVRIDSSPTP
jgi:hypothetical protein